MAQNIFDIQFKSKYSSLITQIRDIYSDNDEDEDILNILKDGESKENTQKHIRNKHWGIKNKYKTTNNLEILLSYLENEEGIDEAVIKHYTEDELFQLYETYLNGGNIFNFNSIESLDKLINYLGKINPDDNYYDGPTFIPSIWQNSQINEKFFKKIQNNMILVSVEIDYNATPISPLTEASFDDDNKTTDSLDTSRSSASNSDSSTASSSTSSGVSIKYITDDYAENNQDVVTIMESIKQGNDDDKTIKLYDDICKTVYKEISDNKPTKKVYKNGSAYFLKFCKDEDINKLDNFKDADASGSIPLKRGIWSYLKEVYLDNTSYNSQDKEEEIIKDLRNEKIQTNVKIVPKNNKFTASEIRKQQLDDIRKILRGGIKRIEETKKKIQDIRDSFKKKDEKLDKSLSDEKVLSENSIFLNDTIYEETIGKIKLKTNCKFYLGEDLEEKNKILTKEDKEKIANIKQHASENKQQQQQKVTKKKRGGENENKITEDEIINYASNETLFDDLNEAFKDKLDKLEKFINGEFFQDDNDNKKKFLENQIFVIYVLHKHYKDLLIQKINEHEDGFDLLYNRIYLATYLRIFDKIINYIPLMEINFEYEGKNNKLIIPDTDYYRRFIRMSDNYFDMIENVDNPDFDLTFKELGNLETLANNLETIIYGYKFEIPISNKNSLFKYVDEEEIENNKELIDKFKDKNEIDAKMISFLGNNFSENKITIPGNSKVKYKNILKNSHRLRYLYNIKVINTQLNNIIKDLKYLKNLTNTGNENIKIRNENIKIRKENIKNILIKFFLIDRTIKNGIFSGSAYTEHLNQIFENIFPNKFWFFDYKDRNEKKFFYNFYDVLTKSKKYTLKDGYLFEVVRKYNEISDILKDIIISKDNDINTNYESLKSIIKLTVSTILTKLKNPPESEQEYKIINEFLITLGIKSDPLTNDKLRKSYILSSIKNLWFSGKKKDLIKDLTEDKEYKSLFEYSIIGEFNEECKIKYNKDVKCDTSRTINDEFLLNLEENCKTQENPTQIQKSNTTAVKPIGKQQAQAAAQVTTQKQEEKELESKSEMIFGPIKAVVDSEERNEFLKNLNILIFPNYKLDTSNSTDIQSQDNLNKGKLQEYLTFVINKFDNDDEVNGSLITRIIKQIISKNNIPNKSKFTFFWKFKYLILLILLIESKKIDLKKLESIPKNRRDDYDTSFKYFYFDNTSDVNGPEYKNALDNINKIIGIADTINKKTQNDSLDKIKEEKIYNSLFDSKDGYFYSGSFLSNLNTDYNKNDTDIVTNFQMNFNYSKEVKQYILDQNK